MEIVHGRIMQNQETIKEDINIYLNVRNDGYLKSWDGHFDVDDFSPGFSREQFRLVLDDGRSGKFFIKNISTGIDSNIGIDFQGTGPLK